MKQSRYAPSDAVLVDLNDKRATRQIIFGLAIPSLVEMLLINFSQMINMILVGRVGAEAVATIGLTSQPYLLLMVLFVALNTGTTVIVARSIGSGNVEEANQAAGQAFILNMMLSIIVAAFSYVYAEHLLLLIGASEDIVQYGLKYAKILFLGIGFTSVSFVLSAILRGAGDTRTPMKINVFANIFELILAFLLIYGHLGLPSMGVTGAAVSTVIGRGISASLLIYTMLSARFTIHLSWRYMIPFNHAMIKRIIRIGLPMSAEQLIMRLGIATFVKISAYLGTVALAANHIVTSIISLSLMPGFAFGVAASTLIGQSLGARRTELAESYVWQIRKYGMIVSGIMGFTIVLLAPNILMLYTVEEEIIHEGTTALRIVGMIQISQASQSILSGALRGAGDTRYPLYSTFIGIWGVRVIFSYIFVYLFHLGLTGLWVAVALDQFLRSVLIYWRFKKGKWKKIDLL